MANRVANCSNLSAKDLFAFTAISDYEKLYDELKEKDSSRNRRNRFWLHHRHENDDKNEDSNEAKEMTKLRDRIVTLSVENGILSKFTSCVGVENNPHKNLIQEEEIELDDNEEIIIQPLMAAMPMQRNYMAKGSSGQLFALAKGSNTKRYKAKALPKRSSHHMNRNYEFGFTRSQRRRRWWKYKELSCGTLRAK